MLNELAFGLAELHVPASFAAYVKNAGVPKILTAMRPRTLGKRRTERQAEA